MSQSDDSAVGFGVVMILAGVAALAWGRRRVALAESSRTWPSVPGTIVASTVGSYRSGEALGRRYYPAVRYTYAVGGREYRSKRIQFDELATNRTQEHIAAILARKYPLGATVPVYYDPSRPGRSVLEPGQTGAHGCGPYGCAFIVVGLFVIVYFGLLRA